MIVGQRTRRRGLRRVWCVPIISAIALRVKNRFCTLLGDLIMIRRCFGLALLLVSCIGLPIALPAADEKPPAGFEPLFNGKDLTGWKVLPGGKMEVWGAK